MKHKQSEERLVHFNCAKCKKWWSIASLPKRKRHWFCPWCGNKA